MIFTELTLHNYGTFKGRHTINLTPPSPEHPVILIGGLNGGGKTTILDAMRLALYGSRADLSNRNGGAWSDYLRDSIHRGVPSQDGASVELEFVAHNDIDTFTYRVRRSWQSRSANVKEHLQVFVNGVLDDVVADSWTDRVEEFIPTEISGLFFFDGERIESLADPDRSGPLISAGIASLLGTSLIDQLKRDLVSLERRQRKKLNERPDSAGVQQVEMLDAEVTALNHELDGAVQSMGAAQMRLDRAESEHNEASEQYRHAGGELAEGRHTLEQGREHLTATVAEHRQHLLGLASGALPLALLRHPLQQVEQQAEAEDAAQLADVLSQTLGERDKALLATLTSADVDSPVLDQIAAFLHADRTRRQPHTHIDRWLNADRELGASLSALLSSVVPAAVSAAQEALTQDSQHREELHNVERRLGQLPDLSDIAPLIKRRDSAAAAVTNASHQLTVAQEKHAQVERLRDRYERDRDRASRTLKETEIGRDKAQRLVAYSAKARHVLAQFADRLTAKHAQRIGQSIFQSFQQLVRKETMVTAMTLDPDTFNLRLTGRDGIAIPAERLSAGERQLLATAVLWGMARLTGRQIPTIIDTPLGRLDSVHRETLVDHYFPKASHQVVLLSTDEEIDRHLHLRLAPEIGRSYRVIYDNDLDCSAVVDGYFWDQEATAHVA